MAKMAEKEKVLWFIEPLEATTNLIVYQALTELDLPAQPTKIAGVINDVWEVPYVFIAYLQRSKSLHYTNFRIYNKKGDVVRKWRLQEPDVRRRSKRRMTNTKKAHISRGREERRVI